MSNFQDLTGNRYGRLIVLNHEPSRVLPSGQRRTMWRVRCDCGTEKVVCAADLKTGKIVSCGCYQKEAVFNRQFEDLTGKQFNRLFVNSLVGKNKKGYYTWNCTCSCGRKTVVESAKLKNGNTKSCGCLQREKSGLNNYKDLTGQKFGYLTVIERDISMPKGKGVYWTCRCACGNIKTLLTKDLTSGHWVTCGCGYGRDNHRLNLIGQKYGELTVVDFAGIMKNHTTWLCECSCGDKIIVDVGRLRSGNTKSCGCIVSAGEQAIVKFLDEHYIQYERQKKFIGCCDKKPLKFDLWLPDRGICIEFDGIQHHQVVNNWNDTEEDFAERQRRDAIKTKYCEENDIILLRIPYWEKDNIESILSDWLFLNEDERNDDDENLCKTAG